MKSPQGTTSPIPTTDNQNRKRPSVENNESTLNKRVRVSDTYLNSQVSITEYMHMQSWIL